MQKMPNNLFFLCGPHGSGKTTLASEFQKLEGVLVPELYMRTIKLDAEPIDRLILKIAQRSLENFEYQEIAKQNPCSMIIGNRCIYDQKIYDKVYSERDWIPEEVREHYDLLADNFYINSLKNPQAIVLNPGFEVVKRHLQKRWSEKGKKWREDDLDYTRLACLGYERLRGKQNIFYIDQEIDFNHRKDIEDAYEWMRSRCQKTEREEVLV
jgi:hypothetical protein